jgi:hypothetical protein
MREERLEVSVTFDERGYIGSAPELRQAVVALSLGASAARSRSRCCLMTCASCCNSMASPSGNVIGGGRRRIAQLDQRTALPDQVLHSAEVDVRPPRRKSGFDPRDIDRTAPD